MTYYVRFADEEEFVVCAPDQADAEEMATDMQRSFGKSEKVVECKIVADK